MSEERWEKDFPELPPCPPCPFLASSLPWSPHFLTTPQADGGPQGHGSRGLYPSSSPVLPRLSKHPLVTPGTKPAAAPPSRDLTH